jgi:hypothetical protein
MARMPEEDSVQQCHGCEEGNDGVPYSRSPITHAGILHLEKTSSELSGWKKYCQTRAVFVAIVALGLLALAARPAADPDLWWHLRTGQLTLQNHAVFRIDPYSFTRAGFPWINHEWLSDVLMFGLYRLSGFGGLIVVFALLITGTYLLVFKRCSGGSYIAGLVTIWAALASRPVWGVRPQVLSLFFVSLLLWLCDARFRHPRVLWWAVPLILLWVNLHAGYALGIALLVLFLMGDLLDAFASSEGWNGIAPRVLTSALVIAASLAVVPLNPYGTKVYSYPISTLRSVSMQSRIAEWFSPNFHDSQYLPLVLLMLATLAALALSSKRVPPGELLLLLAANFAALLSVRHVGIYALIAAPILSRLFNFDFPGRWSRSVPLAGAVLINVAIVVVFAIFVAVHVRTVVKHPTAVEAEMFPLRAVSFLTTLHSPGPILNDYDWGGYLIWRLYPGYRVFIDGRADVYGDALMKDFGDANSLTGNWRGVLERWRIRTVILKTGSPLVTALRTSSDWKPLYSDSQATVMGRVGSR